MCTPCVALTGLENRFVDYQYPGLKPWADFEVRLTAFKTTILDSKLGRTKNIHICQIVNHIIKSKQFLNSFFCQSHLLPITIGVRLCNQPPRYSFPALFRFLGGGGYINNSRQRAASRLRHLHPLAANPAHRTKPTNRLPLPHPSAQKRQIQTRKVSPGKIEQGRIALS